MVFKTIVGATLLAASSTATANAASLVYDTSGQITGVKNVDVAFLGGRAMYDVVFVDGSCVDLFDGCDDPSDSPFDDYRKAENAFAALFSQALSSFIIGDDPSVIAGCESSVLCGFETLGELREYPVGSLDYPSGGLEGYFVEGYRFAGSVPYNDIETFIDFTPFGTPFQSRSVTNPSSSFDTVMAVWSETPPPAPVPLPAGGFLLLSGLSGIAAFKRRKTSAA